MNTIMSPEIRELIDVVHYRPAVSIMMPFEPKMKMKADLLHSVKLAVEKAEQEIKENYPPDLVQPVMEKIKSITRSLDFNTHKKSIAIYVSPVFEKILYLDISVEEKIIVDESFEIRDLVYSKKQLHKYLVLFLSNKESHIFIGNTGSFVRILTDTPASREAAQDSQTGKVANFSDPSERKEVLMHKFLQHIDHTLAIILKAYHLPLFVIGTERIMGHFKKLTKHVASIIDCIHGNYEEATVPEIMQVLAPHIADWKKVMQKDLLNQVEDAAGRNKLAVGMKEVWKEARARKGRLLLVEKNYLFAAEQVDSENIIAANGTGYNQFSYIKDAVDDVIEKVLENGGDVEFVEEDLLKEHEHIVLIKFY